MVAWQLHFQVDLTHLLTLHPGQVLLTGLGCRMYHGDYPRPSWQAWGQLQVRATNSSILAPALELEAEPQATGALSRTIIGDGALKSRSRSIRLNALPQHVLY